MANFPPDILKDWILTTRHELKQCNNKGCYKPNIFHKNLTIFSTEKTHATPNCPCGFFHRWWHQGVKELNAAFEQHAMEVPTWLAGISPAFLGSFFQFTFFEGSEIQRENNMRYIKTLKTKMAGWKISISLLGDSSSFKRLFFPAIHVIFLGCIMVKYSKVVTRMPWWDLEKIFVVKL